MAMERSRAISGLVLRHLQKHDMTEPSTMYRLQ